MESVAGIEIEHRTGIFHLGFCNIANIFPDYFSHAHKHAISCSNYTFYGHFFSLGFLFHAVFILVPVAQLVALVSQLSVSGHLSLEAGRTLATGTND